MNCQKFVQQYLLNRSLTIKANPNIAGIIKDAIEAWKLIEKETKYV